VVAVEMLPAFVTIVCVPSLSSFERVRLVVESARLPFDRCPRLQGCSSVEECGGSKSMGMVVVVVVALGFPASERVPLSQDYV
jgi:hypothetical protein